MLPARGNEKKMKTLFKKVKETSIYISEIIKKKKKKKKKGPRYIASYALRIYIVYLYSLKEKNHGNGIIHIPQKTKKLFIGFVFHLLLSSVNFIEHFPSFYCVSDMYP